MKCLWYCGLAMIVGASMVSPASAQSDWGSPSQIGSYQSILASHQNQNQDQPPAAAGPAVQQSRSVQGQPIEMQHASPQQPGAVYGGQVVQGNHRGMGLNVGNRAAYAPIQGAANYSYGTAAPTYQGQAYAAPGCATPAYSAPANCAPVYSAPTNFGVATAATGNSSVNRVFGVRGLAFNRSYENNRFLVQNPSGAELFTNSADNDIMPGVEAFLTNRNANGGGWEVRYWGLYPDEADATLNGVSFTTALTGLQWVTHGPSGATVQDIYNAASSNRVYRQNDIQNVEINLLRNGGCFRNRRGKQVSFELIGGVRWFEFDESFRYSAFGTAAGYPTDMNYELDVENTLLGIQTGARTETCLTNRLRLAATAKVGLFNNSSCTGQAMYDENGINPYINNGAYVNTPYAFGSKDDSFSMLSELDLGLIYQLSGKSRLNLGYRGLGVTGIALAPNQIPYDFQDVREINQINNDGSLVLHGFYGGMEWCY